MINLNPLTPILEIGSKLIDRLIPNPQKAAEEKLKLLQMEQAGRTEELNAYITLLTAQAATNTEEAKHPSVFVAGWRPAIGWVLGIGLACNIMVYPFINGVFHTNIKVVSTAMLIELIGGMLGLGAIRSFDKLKGLAK